MLGIDVSKEILSCTLLDPSTRHSLWHKEVRNTATGHKQLLRQAPPEAPWILEPTGRYSQGVAREAGRDVRLAQPKKAQLFLESIQSRAKIDKLDAAGLALYVLCCELRPYPLKSEMHDQLLQARKGLSQSLCALQARQRELPRAASALAPAVQAIQAQIQEVDRQVARLTRSPQAPELAVQDLQQVPGIGPVVATTLVSRLSARTFSYSDQFIAYYGLECGCARAGRRADSWGCPNRAELRRLLFLAAQASLRAKNSPFKAQYEREHAKVLSSTAGVCAAARKMARLPWSMATHGSTYEPEHVYQQRKNTRDWPQTLDINHRISGQG